IGDHHQPGAAGTAHVQFRQRAGLAQLSDAPLLRTEQRRNRAFVAGLRAERHHEAHVLLQLVISAAPTGPRPDCRHAGTAATSRAADREAPAADDMPPPVPKPHRNGRGPRGRGRRTPMLSKPRVTMAKVLRVVRTGVATRSRSGPRAGAYPFTGTSGCADDWTYRCAARTIARRAKRESGFGAAGSDSGGCGVPQRVAQQVCGRLAPGVFAQRRTVERTTGMPRATVNGVELFYDQDGEGEPIIFHHGY